MAVVENHREGFTLVGGVISDHVTDEAAGISISHHVGTVDSHVGKVAAAGEGVD